MRSTTKNRVTPPCMQAVSTAMEAGHFQLLINGLKSALLRHGASSLSRLASLKPATLAILIQCSCVLLLLLICRIIQPWWLTYTKLHLDLFALVLMQALVTACLSQLLGMATWWRWIHALFPLATWGMSNIELPHESYLLGFIVSLSLYWSTFRTQVPFFPSRPLIWQQVFTLLPQHKPIRMIDIGSGLGDLVMHLAKTEAETNPDSTSQFAGIEIAPLPWLVSYLRAVLLGSSASFRMGNYHALDFAQYDVVFAYLSPVAMLALWQKAQGEMRTGSRLISYEFEIPGAVPTHIIKSSLDGPLIYVWDIS